MVAQPVGAVAPGRPASGEAEIAACIRQAASRRPWLEKTLWGLRDQEGGWVGAQILNSNGTHDLGPMQVNSWWVGRIAARTGREPAHIRYWLTHHPCFNVDAARWIFLSALAATGDYWQAVGLYHSPTAWRQRRYVLAVVTKLKGRFGARLFAQDNGPGK
ncbi:lytic transglycosylase domain-containing protein [Sphingobium sp. H33]|uniref:Lytic transglycosylase domain-containing protein n=1 Tax=Sphingobium nicotianae TaxID=2782607 RepID=A0A9X1IPH1_9SPHN|nr:lytic transglycosylase domain-containing protein [Sphingobium nicotianae]